MRVLDLFSGIGGFSLGLERTGGFKTVQFCEIDPFCRRVLAKHWPDVPCHDDVTTMRFEEGMADVITGGFPCQDISRAGKQVGMDGERSGLWKEIVRAVRVVRPGFIIVENSPALLDGGLGDILGALATLRFDAEWFVLSAGQLGAPHNRERVWVVAYSQEVARVYQPDIRDRIWRGLLNHGNAWQASPWSSPASAVCRVDDGLSDRVVRTGALGNSIVPQIATLIGAAILKQEAA